MPNLDVWRVVVDERHEAADHEARHRADRLGHGRGHHGLHHQWRVAGDVPVITHLQVRACLHTHTRARARTVSLSSGKLIATYTGTYARIPFILSQYHA